MAPRELKLAARGRSLTVAVLIGCSVTDLVLIGGTGVKARPR